MKRIKQEYVIYMTIFIDDWKNGNSQIKYFLSTNKKEHK